MAVFTHLVAHALPDALITRALAAGLTIPQIVAIVNRRGPLAEKIIEEDVLPLLEGGQPKPA